MCMFVCVCVCVGQAIRLGLELGLGPAPYHEAEAAAGTGHGVVRLRGAHGGVDHLLQIRIQLLRVFGLCMCVRCCSAPAPLLVEFCIVPYCILFTLLYCAQ